MKFKAFEKFKKIVNEYDSKSEKDIIKEIDVNEKNFKQWIEVLLGENNQVDELDMGKLPYHRRNVSIKRANNIRTRMYDIRSNI